MAVISFSREASKEEMGREIDRRGAVIDAITEERDRLALANAKLLAALDAMTNEYLEYVEADMGRELRSRDLPAAWHKARALLTKHKATEGE